LIPKTAGAVIGKKPEKVSARDKAFSMLSPGEQRTALMGKGNTEMPFTQGAMGILDKRTGQIVQQPETEIDIGDLTQDQIDVLGNSYRLTGKMPTLGMGKDAARIRTKILASATKQELGTSTESNKTPSQAALDMIKTQSDTKAIQGAMNLLEKQVSSMGSFVTNMNSQVDKVKSLSKDLETFDTRLLNVPLRALRGKITGSPLQAKYDMYLAEIESEIGKLSQGSTASIAELSQGAQERWSKIHDKNLSVKDMVSLLEETKNAANMRLESVQNEIVKTRGKIGGNQPSNTPQPSSTQKIMKFDSSGNLIQ